MPLTQSQYEIEQYESRLKGALVSLSVLMEDNSHDIKRAFVIVSEAHEFINHQKTELRELDKKYRSALQEIDRLNNIINQLKTE